MNTNYTYEYCCRKANQCWEMASLAHADGDYTDERRLIEEAREWNRKSQEGSNDMSKL